MDGCEENQRDTKDYTKEPIKRPVRNAANLARARIRMQCKDTTTPNE